MVRIFWMWGHDWTEWEDKEVDLESSYGEYGDKAHKYKYRYSVQDKVCHKCNMRKRRKVKC